MRRVLLLFAVTIIFGVYFSIEGKTKSEVLLIGSVHEQHTKPDVYPLSILTKALEVYKPDALLIEISPENLKKQDWTKSPPEAALLYVTAQRLDIPVYGIDADKTKPSKPPTAEAKKERQSLMDDVGGYGFTEVHSPKADKALAKHYKHRDEDREKAMDKNVMTLLQDLKGKRFFVVTGFTHRHHLRQAVDDCCTLVSPLTLSIPKAQVPAEDLKAARKIWEKTLTDLKTSKAPSRKIEQLEKFLTIK
ncbi:hypothetical protein [Bdellovibrio sp. HCB209]|uniref:hypothetical protein n=1 Tax=Bdellovibrio sp. HCB209 TaxID=3394354 RepID=UPI0039B3BB40